MLRLPLRHAKIAALITAVGPGGAQITRQGQRLAQRINRRHPQIDIGGMPQILIAVTTRFGGLHTFYKGMERVKFIAQLYTRLKSAVEVTHAF
ncbi:hypothetical protein D3C79_920420 [compost metagenome]